MSAWPPPAVVLCAGLGTRLRPLTDWRAKPAMPVGNEPLVGVILRRLAAAGITDAIVNLHHLPHTVTREIGDGSQWGLHVRYSWEQPEILGSAGGPRHALSLVDAETVLVVNGDSLSDVPLRTLWDAHVDAGASVTLGLMPHPAPGAYGGVTLGDVVPAAVPRAPAARWLASRVVTGFTPRTSAVPSVHYPGIQLIQRDVLEPLPDNVPAQSVGELYPRMLRETPGAIVGVVFESGWLDVGTIDDYRATSRALGANADGNVIAAGADIHPSARLHRCIVWPEARISADCVLDDVIVTGRTPLAAGTQLTSTIA